MSRTVFRENHHYVPEPDWVAGACTVLRAGLAVTSSEHAIERASYHGQDILFCLSGRGFVLSEDRTIPVEPGQLAWLANEERHGHWPDPVDPWTVLFARIDGPNCALLRRKIFGTGPSLATLRKPREVEAWFTELFGVLKARPDDVDLVLNRLVAQLLNIIAAPSPHAGGSRLPPHLRAVLDEMRQAPEKAWQAEDISSLTGISPTQIRRLFQKHLQITPRRWLLRERIMMAQKLLLDSDESISKIADRCGFFDVYHFSREFKRLAGASPRRWREDEGH